MLVIRILPILLLLLWPTHWPGQTALAEVHTGMDEAAGTTISAVELEHEVARIAARTAGGDDLWPGFDILALPLAVYDGEQSLLFRHPSPPAKFNRVADSDPPVYVYDGHYEAIFADSTAEIGGVLTATRLIDRLPPDHTLTDAAAVAVHEAFHGYQQSRHPDWMANVAALFTYPMDDHEILALHRRETESLRQALTANDPDAAACRTRAAITLRKERRARMESEHAEYENGIALYEGLAFYIERTAAGRFPAELPAAGFGPEQIRRRAHETGTGLAVLLDRFRPGTWKKSLSDNDEQTLDELLAQAIGAGEQCGLDSQTVQSIESSSLQEVNELVAAWAARLEKFKARPGWRIVIKAADDNLLWPRQIDPVNIEPLGNQQLLHTRAIHLGNSFGQVEVTNATALTEGAGSHPLFEGVHRVMLTGLPKPKINHDDGTVSVETTGLKLTLNNAAVDESDKTITITLGS